MKILRHFGILGFIGIATALFYQALVAAQAPQAFYDVPSGHPNATAIYELKSRGALSGYPDGAFRPNQPVNRAEALKIILLSSKIDVPEIMTSSGFLDIAPEAWFAKYVAKARNLKIIEGYSDGTFRGYQTVNLVENLKILLNANSVDLENVIVLEDSYRDAYKNQWYSKYVGYAKTKNLIDADGRNMVYPAQGVTRAKLAEIMYRFTLQLTSGSTGKTYSSSSAVTAASGLSTGSTPTSTSVGGTTGLSSGSTAFSPALSPPSAYSVPITPSTVPPPPPAAVTPAGPLACPTSATLESLVTCIISHFSPFVVPTATEQADFRSTVNQMLNGKCSNIVLPATLANIYTVKTFTDTQNSKSYCLLIESGDKDGDGKVDKGWGTFIVNNNASRELNIAIVHPINDALTENQGIGIFKATDSRTFLLAGATRNLGGESACDSRYDTSDAAHNVGNMFFPATQEIDGWYGAKSWLQIQFHGMAASTCPGVDAFMVYGVNTPPKTGDNILKFKANILKYHPGWSVTTFGDTPECGLTGTGNLPGRYLNQPDGRNYCSVSSKIYSQKFIHIEQAPGFREANDWVQAVKDTW